MPVDLKAGYVIQTVSLSIFLYNNACSEQILMMGFDIFNSFLYQFYTLAPFPIIICTGYLCNGAVKPATLWVRFQSSQLSWKH